MKSRSDFASTEEYKEYIRVYYTAAAMQGMLANTNGCFTRHGTRSLHPDKIAERAITQAERVLELMEAEQSVEL